MILFVGPWRPEEMDAPYPASFGLGRTLVPVNEISMGWLLATADVQLVAFRIAFDDDARRETTIGTIRRLRALYDGPVAVLDPEKAEDTSIALRYVHAGADAVAGEPKTFHNLVASMKETATHA